MEDVMVASEAPDIEMIELNKHLFKFWSSRLDHKVRTNIIFASSEQIESKTQSGLVMLPGPAAPNSKLAPDDVADAGLNAISALCGLIRRSNSHLDFTVLLAGTVKAVADGFKMNDEMSTRLMAAVAFLFLAPPMPGPKGDQ